MGSIYVCKEVWDPKDLGSNLILITSWGKWFKTLWVSVSLVIYHKRFLQHLNGYKSSTWHQNHIVHLTFLSVLEVIMHQGISYFNWLHTSIMPDCSTYSMCYFFRNKHTTSKLENNQKFKISSFPWLQLQ